MTINNHSKQPRVSQNRGGELKPIRVCAEVDNGSPAYPYDIVTRRYKLKWTTKTN